jgi:hypothetical protein
MLADGIVQYLVGSGSARLNYVAGDSAVVRLSADQRHPTYLLTTPRGDQIRQSADEKQDSLVVTSTDVPGNYRLRAGGETQGVDLGFSVNLSEDVSQLERATDEDLKAVFGETAYRLAHNREEIDRSVSMGRVGRELYPYLIVLLALILGGEQILSNRFYRNDEPVVS